MTKIKKIRVALYLLLIVQVSLSAIFLAHKYSIAVDSNNIKELTIQGVAKQKTRYLRGTYVMLDINDVSLWCKDTKSTAIPSCNEYIKPGEKYTVKLLHTTGESWQRISGIVFDIRDSTTSIYTKDRGIALQEIEKSVYLDIKFWIIFFSIVFCFPLILLIKFGYNNFERDAP